MNQNETTEAIQTLEELQAVISRLIDLIKEVRDARARIEATKKKPRSKETLIELHEAKKEFEGLRMVFYRKANSVLVEAGFLEEN